MAIIDYNNGTATISINGGQPPFSYLLLQNDAAVNYPGVNFQNPVVSSNSSVVFGNSSDTSGTYGLPSGTYTCQVTDNAGCIINTSEIVIGQTMEATTTTILPTTTSTTLLQEYLTLTVDQSPVDEGLNILFTLTSLNIPNGTLIDWNITGGITSDDISGGLGGSFTIQNNQAQYLATIESDEILEGQETFTLALAAIDSNGVSAGLSVNVIINDMNTAATTLATTSTTQPTTSTTLATTSTTLATTSTTLATTSTTLATTSTTLATTSTTLATTSTTLATTSTTLAASYDNLTVQSQINEGQVALFTLTGSNIPDGATVGYFLTGIDPGDLQNPSAMTGTFTMSNNMDQHTIAVASDFLTEGLETMYLELDATDSNGVTAGLTASVDIIDTSLNPTTPATTSTTLATTSTTLATTSTTLATTSTTLATTSTTLATTTTAAPLEHTFYHFHAGGGSVAPYSDLSAGGTFYMSTGAGTQDLSVMMADLIENGDGQTSSAQVAMPLVTSFEFSGPITGNDCGTSWTSNVSAGLNFFWLAVPNNADFTENLITDGVLQYDCNGQPYNANNRTAFTYNAESYWLYKLAAAPASNAQTYGFK